MKLLNRHPAGQQQGEQPGANGAKPSVETGNLPVDPKTGQPIPPRAQPGYYPGYETLSQQAFWDKATRDVVLKRVSEVPEIRFFSEAERAAMSAIADRIVPQDDRDEGHKIPIVPFIDERLYNNKIDGYRYATMPSDQDAYRLGISAIQAIANHLYGKDFQDLRSDQQDYVLETIHDEVPPAGEEIWQRMPVRRFWQMLLNDCVTVYYAHPWAWDEIGFGGPAYPRGYMRLHHGEPEPWEVRERRYDWDGPPLSLSDVYRPIGREDPLDKELQAGFGGSSGTH